MSGPALLAWILQAAFFLDAPSRCVNAVDALDVTKTNAGRVRAKDREPTKGLHRPSPTTTPLSTSTAHHHPEKKVLISYIQDFALPIHFYFLKFLFVKFATMNTADITPSKKVKFATRRLSTRS